MKVLITGGAGFIGSNIVHYWLDNYPKDIVINLDALKYSGNLDNLRDIEKSPKYKFYHSDISRYDEIEPIFKQGVDVVVNFAAQTHVDRSLYEPNEFINSNIIGTRNLLEACLKYQVKRFHQISTDEVFGDLAINDKHKFTAETLLNPSNEYAASKASAEMFIMAYLHTHHLPATISNCTNNIGPYQYPEKFVPLAITNILEGKKVPVYGTGKNIRDWIYVIDHCRAIDVILKKGKPGERYLIGSDHREINNIQLLSKIIKVMDIPGDWMEFVTDRPGHDRKYAVDWTKIGKLGWKPKYSLDQSIRLTVEWYMKNTRWWKKIKSGEYRKAYEKIYGKNY
ncbi:dTDP-glucose 4,6-dehydratase [Candidatus Amesbacteria bacterium RIFCSPHIGHO2_01_FULL_48_32]|uniref:dTDP-glucose 4,6-dehydratase n=1 Tax=Candidatus Amesbacteria bacterium RIFCSPLOWO2_01_FULL_48_25 TaxID=1797259 RepID=A0A1F4ZDI9_9BACT|nr:MAG: dTDP-glucose 4,6-dehydratase [Candidatus Amesbacteria bacterium RIFCSPHIGHO2_01_FULL_48_32]OGD04046.1 MAG: dTDP-glucose 4,6-dehydratase [Candidatus Amesbacteria bacterium RIFCSPLOWO2_01_FULL_48_25]HJZ05690.1 dTDP-glucose 4,6-dehydratase [Patescibacteria group bacterium]